MLPANRRNLYRLLHVQPDAPLPVIKAAYRALIALHHPDKGGDHTTATLLNDAYAVLSDPEQRAVYDEQRMPRGPRGAKPQCPVCSVELPARQDALGRCPRCSAPLTAPRAAHAPGRPNDRRGMPRVSKADWAQLQVGWPPQLLEVRLRDLSLDGISLYSGAPLPAGTTVRVTNEAIDVVARVVSCRRMSAVHILHAHLVSAHFTRAKGSFVVAEA
jgi:hypothetical protein